MKQYFLILIIAVSMLASATYLSYIGEKQMDPDSGKNWWVLSFDEPKGKSLDFSIENHSSETSFHWQILMEKDAVTQGDLTIGRGKTGSVNVPPADIQDKKITIVVTSKDDKKEIYKIL